MKQLIILFALVAQGYCDHRTYRFVKVEGSIRIPQDIGYDTETNTVTIVVGDVSDYKNMVPTVNFHDFDTGYVVFKHIRHQLCLLSKSPIPFPTPFIYGLGETNITLDYVASIKNDLLTHDKVTEIAGSRISSFCKDYRTYYMNLTKLPPNSQIKRRDLLEDDPGTCSQHCGTCYIILPKNGLAMLSALG